MKNVVLYIAMSLDGYIADSKGSVDWIKGQSDSSEMPDTYSPFFKNIDTVILGKRTYDQIITELSPDEWPYSEATTYVFTHDTLMTNTKDIKFTNANPWETGKNIWVCGGADIVNQLMKEDLIDIYHIAIIPVILGGGIRLFDTTDNQVNLRLIETLNYNGITEVIYESR